MMQGEAPKPGKVGPGAEAARHQKQQFAAGPREPRRQHRKQGVHVRLRLLGARQGVARVVLAELEIRRVGNDHVIGGRRG